MFITTELDKYSSEITKIAQKRFPKESKKFLRDEGTKLKRLVLKFAKQSVNKKTGNLFKGIKRGKVYSFRKKDNLAIRVYAGKPAYHAHLLNNGHRMVVLRGKRSEKRKYDTGKFVKGHEFFEKASDKFEPVFNSDIQDFIDRITEKL